MSSIETPAPGRRRQIVLWIAAAAAALVAWGVFAHWTPSAGAEHSICLFRRVTGVSCPGCGMTRAAALLAKGELAEAFRMHPLAPVLAVEAGLAWLAWGVMIRRRLPLPAWLVPLLLAHAGVFLALWLGRLASGTLPP